jgi:hypothetical protein
MKLRFQSFMFIYPPAQVMQFMELEPLWFLPKIFTTHARMFRFKLHKLHHLGGKMSIKPKNRNFMRLDLQAHALSEKVLC